MRFRFALLAPWFALVVVRPLHSQSVRDTALPHPSPTLHANYEDSVATRILDDPGGSAVNPDEAFEYLDGLSSTTGTSLERLHADPETSWIKAHRLIRRGDNLVRDTTTDQAGHVRLRSRGDWPVDAEEQHGFQSGEYLGSPGAYTNQIRASSASDSGRVAVPIDLGFAQQKQSWEPDLTDRLSGFAALRNAIPLAEPIAIERAVAGDYSLAFGDGLLFGGGASASKSVSAVGAVEERSFCIRGALGNASGHNMRGGAMEIGLELSSSIKSDVTLFASDRSIDANVVSDTIHTLYTTDYHRTATEMATKNAASVSTTGLRIALSNPDTSALFLRAGGTAYAFAYDHPYGGTASAPFVGRSLEAASVDLLAIGSNYSVTGEAATMRNDTSVKQALAASFILEPTPLIGVSLHYRHIPFGFISPFGELGGSTIQSLSNADAMYLGIEASPLPGALRFNAYADIGKAILPLADLFPRKSQDYLASCYATFFEDRALGTKLEASVAVRNVQSETMVTVAGPLISTYATSIRNQWSTRAEVIDHWDKDLTGRFRYEHIAVSLPDGGHETGYLYCDEIAANIRPLRLHIDASMTRFETASFQSALTLYEPGVPGLGSIQVLDGAGWRLTARLTARILRGLNISLTGAGTFYDDARTIGSGVTARVGDSILDCSAQFDLTL